MFVIKTILITENILEQLQLLTIPEIRGGQPIITEADPNKSEKNVARPKFSAKPHGGTLAIKLN
jgi:hypothetical protein